MEEPEKEMNEKEDKKWVCPICDKEKSSSDKKHHYEGNEYLDINLDGTYEGFICSSCYEDLEEDLEEELDDAKTARDEAEHYNSDVFALTMVLHWFTPSDYTGILPPHSIIFVKPKSCF